MKTIFKWIGNILLTIIIICAVMAAYSLINAKRNPNSVPGIGPYKFMSVLSGSMSPTFNTYDMIVDKNVSPENLKKGDVITFREDTKTLVTHRIVDIQNINGKRAYKTRGDANNVDDERLVYDSEIEGVYQFRIPYGGLVMSKIKGPIGLIIVWLLLMYVVLSEFVFKKKENAGGKAENQQNNENKQGLSN